MSSNVCVSDECSDDNDSGNASIRSIDGDSLKDSGSYEDFSQSLEKLEKLKLVCFEKNLEKTEVKRCIESINVAEFLKGFASDEWSKNYSGPGKSKRCIRNILKSKEESNNIAHTLVKENWDLEKKIINKKLQFEDCMLQREKLWKQTIKISQFGSRNLSGCESFDESDVISETYDCKQKAKENKINNLNVGVAAKSYRISELSRLLQVLIVAKGVSWTSNKNLLQILLCTSKMLDRNFGVRNCKELRKIVDDIIHRLNSVKI